MTCRSPRAARLRHLIPFALVSLASANLAHSATPDLAFNPTVLAFKYQAGAALPASQTLQIRSTGASLDFTIAITGPLPYQARWLAVSANSGATSASLKVFVNPNGLPSGSYSGTIIVTAPGAATANQNFPVTLDVGDPPASLTVNSNTLTFNYVTGLTLPASQNIVLMTTGSALTASIAVTGAWLKASPSGNIAMVGFPATVKVDADPSGLSPGAYSGKITFASTTAANKSVVVNVVLNVTAGVPTISNGGIWPPGILASSPATTITISGTNYFPTTVAYAGTTALTTTYLSPTSLLAVLPANLLTNVGNLAISVSTPTASAASISRTFAVYGPGPQIWAVADAASYATGSVSAGEILTIYGIGLGPATLVTFAGADPVPASLPTSGAATSVTIDGVSAPLIYASSNQVSCIVPYTVAAKVGNFLDLVLTYNSLASSVLPVAVVDANPGIFAIDGSGSGQGAILNYNATTGDYTVNGASNPATKGSIVVIYITGFGQTNPAGDETRLISGSVAAVAAVGVTIGGQTATVQGALAPVGSVPGLLQINATVPTNITAGAAVPVVVTVGAAQSQARVTMVVK